jgi:hypothetical protein
MTDKDRALVEQLVANSTRAALTEIKQSNAAERAAERAEFERRLQGVAVEGTAEKSLPPLLPPTFMVELTVPWITNEATTIVAKLASVGEAEVARPNDQLVDPMTEIAHVQRTSHKNCFVWSGGSHHLAI